MKQLRGFSKIGVPAGGNVTVEFDLMRRDLSTWDTGSQGWVLQGGNYNIWVGASSRNLPLKGTLTL